LKIHSLKHLDCHSQWRSQSNCCKFNLLTHFKNFDERKRKSTENDRMIKRKKTNEKIEESDEEEETQETEEEETELPTSPTVDEMESKLSPIIDQVISDIISNEEEKKLNVNEKFKEEEEEKVEPTSVQKEEEKKIFYPFCLSNLLCDDEPDSEKIKINNLLN
jgi:hypothetical protein